MSDEISLATWSFHKILAPTLTKLLKRRHSWLFSEPINLSRRFARFILWVMATYSIKINRIFLFIFWDLRIPVYLVIWKKYSMRINIYLSWLTALTKIAATYLLWKSIRKLLISRVLRTELIISIISTLTQSKSTCTE